MAMGILFDLEVVARISQSLQVSQVRHAFFILLYLLIKNMHLVN